MIFDTTDPFVSELAKRSAGDDFHPCHIVMNFPYEVIEEYGFPDFELDIADILSCYAADKLAMAGEAADLLAARDRHYQKDEGDEVTCLPGHVSEQEAEFYRQVEPLKESFPPLKFITPSDEEHPKAVMVLLFERAATETGVLALMVSIRDLLTWHIVARIRRGDEPSLISAFLEIRDRFYPKDDTWDWKIGVWELPGAYAWYEYPLDEAA